MGVRNYYKQILKSSPNFEETPESHFLQTRLQRFYETLPIENRPSTILQFGIQPAP